MTREYRLGTLWGLQLTMTLRAPIASLVVWVLLSAGAYWLLRLPLVPALLAGLAAIALHWLAGIAHHLGHAWAAARTGYPMRGIRMGTMVGGIVSTSVYPPDEPPLPAAIHIQRALGGPMASLALTFAAGLVALALRPVGGAIWDVAFFFFLDNLFVYTLQALLPLGFNDASTILYWWRQREHAA